MNLMHVMPVRRRRNGKQEDTIRRQATVSYTLPDGTGTFVHVCRQTFMDVFDIKHKRIEILLKKKKQGETVYNEGRGKYHRESKFTEQDTQQVKNHINSIPRTESHYSRASLPKNI